MDITETLKFSMKYRKMLTPAMDKKLTALNKHLYNKAGYCKHLVATKKLANCNIPPTRKNPTKALRMLFKDPRSVTISTAYTDSKTGSKTDLSVH